jgi:hypothetical protein
MDIQQRLAEFFRRLQAAPPVANAGEAMQLVCRLVEEVEDELCPLPREAPPPIRPTGRMYAPQRDHIDPTPGGGLTARTRRHLIYCGHDGRIIIVHRHSRAVVLRKEGKPG